MAENSFSLEMQADAYDLAHELANTVTHGLGLALAVAGTVVLVALAATRGDAWQIVSCGIFGATLITLYLASTLYHSFRRPRLKYIFRILDHSAIYLLIAGTYTPFTLTHLRGFWGWLLLVLAWSLAIAGCAFKAFFIGKFPKASAGLYIAMGWMVIIAAKPAFVALPMGALLWLLAGGLLYTAGVAFFAWNRLRFNHAIWHVFVLGGSVCHYLAVLFYVIPQRG